MGVLSRLARVQGTLKSEVDVDGLFLHGMGKAMISNLLGVGYLRFALHLFFL